MGHKLNLDVSRQNTKVLGPAPDSAPRHQEEKPKEREPEPIEVDLAPVAPQEMNSPYDKVRLNSVELVVGESGAFEFNKKCKAKAIIEILDARDARLSTMESLSLGEGDHWTRTRYASKCL